MGEKLQQELAKKKKKEARKAKEILRRSKQILHRASKESIKKSQSLFKKKSTDSLKGENFFKNSLSNLRRSLSKEHVRQSKAHLYDKETNLSSKNLSQGGSSNGNPVSKQKMQNYLVSQVLFDGKEDVRTSRMQLQSRAAAIQEEKEREKRAEEARIEEENKRKELAMIERENQMKRQIEEELNRIKKIEEEQRIKHEEAQFESYKKEMEKYLNFVCEDDDSKPKKAKRKSVVKQAAEEPSKKLTLNIGSLKNQFEEGEASGGKETPSVKSAPANVRKLNPIKIFNEQKEEEKKPKKKEYVPVIIDKAAFERTVGMFEKEKQEKEDNEKRIKKRKGLFLRRSDKWLRKSYKS